MNEYSLQIPNDLIWFYSVIDENETDIDLHYTDIVLRYGIDNKIPTLVVSEALDNDKAIRIKKYIFDSICATV